MREYNAESPKQGRKRFNSIVKTINIADLGIIYLCFETMAFRRNKFPEPKFLVLWNLEVILQTCMTEIEKQE